MSTTEGREGTAPPATCPQCGSSRVGEIYKGYMDFFDDGFRKWRCGGCGHEWLTRRKGGGHGDGR